MNPRKRTGRSRLLWPLLALFTTIVILSSCYRTVAGPVHEAVSSGANDEIRCNEPPPFPRSEVVVGLAPGPNHHWAGGYWTSHRDHWYWVDGRWAARPHPVAVWEDGRWEHQPRGYVRVGGHWR